VIARPLPLVGGCLCGAVRYEVRGAPLMVVACHCRDCQKRTSSAYSMNLPVWTRDFALVAGAPREIERRSPSGFLTRHIYCNDCMSRLASMPERSPATVSVRPGTLDDTSWLVPTLHIFARSALPGAIPQGATQFQTDPPDFAPFAIAFAKAWNGA
jgi:hypothetical protein